MSYEKRVKETLEGRNKLTRQQKRSMQRSGKKFEERQTFTKDELHNANMASYEYGKQLVLLAAKEVIGLGPKRLDRIAEVIDRLEFEAFVKPFEGEGPK